MEVRLGFGPIPKPEYVFVNKESDHCWHLLEDGNPIPVYEKALTGVITGLEVRKIVQTSHGEAIKTDLHVFAHKPYVVRSGRESFYSKSLLLSLDVLSQEQLLQPISITVNPGDKNTVFCGIYNPITYRVVEFSWDGHKELDWYAIEDRVSSKINSLVLKQPLQLLNNTPQVPQVSVSTDELIAESDTYLSRLNWTPQQGKEYLLKTYGKRSRQHLSAAELQEFIAYLKTLNTSVRV